MQQLDGRSLKGIVGGTVDTITINGPVTYNGVVTNNVVLTMTFVNMTQVPAGYYAYLTLSDLEALKNPGYKKINDVFTCSGPKDADAPCSVTMNLVTSAP